METRKLNIALAVLSGVMLGFSFPPFRTGIFAGFAFVPLFILFESIEEYGRTFRYSYLTFFVFNLVTLYWTGGFVHGKDPYLMIAGCLLILAHPIFFGVPILAWLFFRRHFGFKYAIISFPFFWVAFEYLHSLFEIGFPWLTLGNSQTYDLSLIQFSSYTGVYGISFWVLWINVLGYILYARLALKEWTLKSPQTIGYALLMLILYFIPKIHGSLVLGNGDRNDEAWTLRIGIVQPNIDPFEKWSANSDEQICILHDLTNQISARRVDLVLWPETATPFYILMPENRYHFDLIKRQVDSLGVNLLTGIPDIVYYREGDVIPKSSKVTKSGQRYETFNSSMLLQPNANAIQKYAKILLVPFAERVPFSETLHFLNAMRWNFGLGGWGIGRDTTVFYFKDKSNRELRFSNLICYESIYPGFVANFVRKGAQFLTIVTNDSWWGNTSGAYQHQQFAILRAVENRRWIARCANGGISCFIDPFGHILSPTNLFTQATIVGDIEPRSDLSFYSKHGDWFAEICVLLSAFFLAAAAGKLVYFKIRSRDDDEIYRSAQ